MSDDYTGRLAPYAPDLESAEASARSRIEEWDYRSDPHGYCHERPDWIALLDEIERLRAALDNWHDGADKADPDGRHPSWCWENETYGYEPESWECICGAPDE